MFTFNEINSNFRDILFSKLPSVLSVSSVADSGAKCQFKSATEDTDSTEGSFRDYWNPPQR